VWAQVITTISSAKRAFDTRRQSAAQAIPMSCDTLFVCPGARHRTCHQDQGLFPATATGLRAVAVRGASAALSKASATAAFRVGAWSSRPSVVCADDDSERRGVMADSDFHLKAPGYRFLYKQKS
jgi:hypothetical protein